MDSLFLSLYVGLLGTVLGSFASVLIHRIRSQENGILMWRSHCPACGHGLAWYDLFPILSWIALHGRCRYCQTRISSWYPILEIAMAVAFVGIVYSVSPVWGDIASITQAVWFVVIAFVVVVWSVYDLRWREIPDEVVVPACLVVLGVLIMDSILPSPAVTAYFAPIGGASFWNIPLVNGLTGAFALYSFLYLQILIPGILYAWKVGKWSIARDIVVLYITFPWLVVRDLFIGYRPIPENDTTNNDDLPPSWVGYGDLRIALFMGLVGGLKIAILGMWLGYLVGSIFGVYIIATRKNRESSEIAFGPFLGVGLLLSLGWYTPIVSVIISLFHIDG